MELETVYTIAKHCKDQSQFIKVMADEKVTVHTAIAHADLKTILKVIANRYGLTVDMVWRTGRIGAYVRIRRIFIHVCCIYLDMEPLNVGAFLNMDRTTVLYHMNTSIAMMDTYKTYREEIEHFKFFKNNQ